MHEFLASEKQYSCEYLAVLWKSPGRERASLHPLLISSFLLSSLSLLSGKQGLFLLLPSLQNHLPCHLLYLISVCGTQCSQIQYAAPLITELTIFCCVVLYRYIQHLKFSWHQSWLLQSVVLNLNFCVWAKFFTVALSGMLWGKYAWFWYIFFNQMVILYFCGHRCSINVNLWGVLFGIFFPKLVLHVFTFLTEKLSMWTVPLRTWP